MEINITGRNLDLNDALKTYIHMKLEKLERIYKRIYRCEVVLEESKARKNVEIILHLKRNRMIAKQSSPDIYASIDNAVESIKKQLSRLTDKVNSKRRRGVFIKLMEPVTRLARRKKKEMVFESGGRIIKVNLFADEPMLPEEARLELSGTNKTFIMFRNADTGEANVIYKRGDGNYGLIEPL